MTTKWRAAGVVAAVYGFFLIFAQFALVEILRAHGVGLAGEKTVLGAMAVAGMAAGFLVAWRGVSVAVLRASLVLGVVAAGLGGWVDGFLSGLFVGVLSGLAIGGATVSVAALLPGWCGVAWAGLGTGLGYALCNVPWVFSAQPGTQAWVGAGFALCGLVLVPGAGEAAPASSRPPRSRVATVAVVLAFLALVWLDSAAFFIIQHERDLKAGTWGEAMLWRNALLHLGAALVAGWWFARDGWKGPVVAAWVLLAAAALAVNGEGSRPLAGWLYPVGVSLYSTALVAWPGYGAPGARVEWRAAWVFAVAGWFGSANGIGMAETLHRVPTVFVVVAGIVVLVGAMGGRWRALAAIGAVAGIGCLFSKDASPAGDAVERGRRVYLEEGCITCHSRYVRPKDPEGWGPVSDPRKVLAESPVLIGNRRQGPDLSHVGARRSGAWLREHFEAPREFVRGSTMPSYGYLFEDGRGEDLIAWLMDDQSEALVWRMEQAAEWRPEGMASGDGAALFAAHCAVCHGPEGHGNGRMADRFAKRPANLVEGPFVWTADLSALPKVIKWGVPGTDMPGHELLEDGEVLALAEWLREMRE